MMGMSGKSPDGGDLAAILAAQLRQPDNRRHLARLPLFKASNDDTMDHFASLLGRLDRAESRGGSGRN